MTPRLIVITVSLAIVSVMHADDHVIAAPKGTYTITQHYAEFWDSTPHFRDARLGVAPLAADPDRYPWSATYLISPDDEWILRVQKTGFGQNSAFLYRVEPSGRLWRMAQCLDDLAFGFLARKHVKRSDFYHTGIQFLAWDLPKHTLRFR